MVAAILASAALTGAPPPRVATTAELDWLRSFGRITQPVFAAYGAALNLTERYGGPQPPLPPARRRAALRRDLAAAARCARLRYPAPPTRQLDVGLRLQHRLCRKLVAASTTQSPSEARRRLWASVATSNRVDDWLIGGVTRPLPHRGNVAASHIDPRYSRAASLVAHKRVTIRCWTGNDYGPIFDAMGAEYALFRRVYAFAPLGGLSANVGRPQCLLLDSVTYRHRYGASDGERFAVATALLTLAHEPNHLRGISDEAVAQCYALQLVPQVAAALEIPAPWGRRYADMLWRNWRRVARGAYYTSQCRNGGPLDLRPSSARWP